MVTFSSYLECSAYHEYIHDTYYMRGIPNEKENQKNT